MTLFHIIFVCFFFFCCVRMVTILIQILAPEIITKDKNELFLMSRLTTQENGLTLRPVNSENDRMRELNERLNSS